MNIVKAIIILVLGIIGPWVLAFLVGDHFKNQEQFFFFALILTDLELFFFMLWVIISYGGII